MSFPFGGFGLENLTLHRKMKTRSISAENFTGEKGKGGMAEKGAMSVPSRELGKGWKVSPCIVIKEKGITTLAEIEGPGVIQHIWITTDQANWRKLILRFYWDDEETPSIAVPLGDFFAQCWHSHSQVSSIPVAVNPRGALNCYWPMPFRKAAKITIENTTNEDLGFFFYQITYGLTEVSQDAAYLHASFRRENPTDYKVPFTMIDHIKGRGHYVGCFMGWQTNNTGWWGEGEIKFYMDGDQEYPTICGTGTEDYFGGAWGFEEPPGTYKTYTTPYLGFHLHEGGDGHTKQGRRFGLYRWHIADPIYFEEDLKITMQALGIGQERDGEGRYLPLRDDICSVSYWYQSEPHAPESVKNEFSDHYLTIV